MRPTQVKNVDELPNGWWGKAYKVASLLINGDAPAYANAGISLYQTLVTDDEKEQLVNQGTILFLDKRGTEWVKSKHRIYIIENGDGTYRVEILENDSEDDLMFLNESVKPEELHDVVFAEANKIKTAFFGE